jgi:hypothetical protein
MIVVPNYRGSRIEIAAQPVGDAWDAGVRIRCPRSNEVRRAEYIPCRKSTPVEAEHAADLWARRLMDAMARLARVRRGRAAETTTVLARPPSASAGTAPNTTGGPRLPQHAV